MQEDAITAAAAIVDNGVGDIDIASLSVKDGDAGRRPSGTTSNFEQGQGSQDISSSSGSNHTAGVNAPPLSNAAQAALHKKVEKMKEMEQEIFDLKKKLERAESRLVLVTPCWCCCYVVGTGGVVVMLFVLFFLTFFLNYYIFLLISFSVILLFLCSQRSKANPPHMHVSCS